MKRVVTLLLLLFTTYSYAQITRPVVKFEPQQIDNGLKRKPFFKQGRFTYVDNVKFRNDTNYFNFYIVNNSSEPWQLMTVEGQELCDLIMTQIPKVGEPYKELLKVEDTEFIFCGNSYFNKTLPANNFIVKEFAIPCEMCGEKEKTTVRFDLITSDDPFEKENAYFFSNAFTFYYDDYVFEEYKKSFWLNGKSITLSLQSKTATYLTADDILALDRKIYLDTPYIDYYKIKSFTLYVAFEDNTNDAIHSEINKIPIEAFTRIKTNRKKIKSLIVDDIRAFNTKLNMPINIASKVFTVLQKSDLVYINLTSPSYSFTKRAFQQISDSLLFSPNNYTIESFNLGILSKGFSSYLSVLVKIVGNKLSPNVFGVVCEEQNEQITFKNIIIRNNTSLETSSIPKIVISIE